MLRWGRVARLVVATVAAGGLVVGGLLTAEAAFAADSISISPTSVSAASNTPTTYTLTVSCSTTGGCANSTVSFPTTALVGDGSTTDFASWVTDGSCPAMTKPTGQVVFTYSTFPTGTQTCTFTVRPTAKTTLNGAQATITPTFTNSGVSVTAATPATLTATATHDDTLGAGASPTNVVGGAPLTLTFTFGCGTNATQASDLGLSALNITDVLPPNFTFTSLSTAPISANLQGTITTPAAGTSGGTISYTGNGSDCTNPANNRIVFTVTGTASTAGAPDAVGDTITNNANATFTYLDGFADSKSASAVATVIDLDYQAGKSVTPKTLNNNGQYKALDGTTPSLYTFPGDWDSSGGDTSYDLTVASKPAVANAGLIYSVQDPLPCIDTLSGAKYLSNAPGVPCANPAYVPKVITVTGFTPAVGATIQLLMADGTTQNVAYVAGTGWTLPTSPAVSEIDIPTFAQEGSNPTAIIDFHITGYASTADVPGHILTNTAAATAYLAGTTTMVKTSQQPTANILVADPTADGDGALTAPGFATAYSGSCVERVQPSGTTMEIATAPSKAIYMAYLAPYGVGTISVPALAFTLTGSNGHTYTANGVAVASQTTNYNGTGRTLIEWTIPAGMAVVPGVYTLGMTGFNVTLPAGCSGTYQNAFTVGYGAAIPACVANGGLHTPPYQAASDAALTTNGSPIAGNYCGTAAPISVSASGYGFSVDKSVQGNLDATPVTAGGTGKVSPTGGTATYTVTFTNTGLANLHDPVMYDLLPRIGDTDATSTTARGSQFPVSLTSVPTPPAGVSVEYSTAANPCRPEVLANASNPGCVDDWSATAPSPLSQTTALRISYDGTVGVTGSPFPQSVSMSYGVATPNAAVGDVAWNTVGTNVHEGDTGDPTATTDYVGAAESSRTGLAAQSAQPAITKTASRTTVDAVGQQIVYTFTVTDNTAVPLTNVRVADALTDAASGATVPTPVCTSLTTPAGTCSGASASLEPGQSAVFTASYTTTQADLDHGDISDQATATANPPTGGSLTSTSGVVTVTATQNPALALLKTASPSTVKAVGDTISYDYAITNAGNVTLNAPAIVEKAFSGSGSLSSIACPSGPLAPGVTVDCTASYPVTQADLTAGSVVNTADATATDPSGAAVTSADSTAEVTVDQVAALSLVKSVTPSTAASYNAGQLVTYSFVVANTGNVPVTGIAVNEENFSGTGMLSAISCPGSSLAPGAQLSCTATYTLTQGDVDSASLVNTADATGTAVTGPVTSNDSTATTPQDPNASLSLTKTADTAFVNAAGDTITYTFAITNTGNVTLHDAQADETAFSGTGTQPTPSCPSTDIIPGAEIDCTATYTVTQGDMDAGKITNTAKAVAVDPSGNDVTSSASSVTVRVNSAPALALVKSADVSSYDAVGDAIAYSFLVTNTGNVTLTGVDIAEGAFTGSGALSNVVCPPVSLAPGASLVCAADYTTTQADIDRGSISNTAAALGSSPTGDVAVSAASTVKVNADLKPTLTLLKTVSPTTADAAGDAVTYTFELTNTGNVTLTGLAVAESAFSGTGTLAAPACATTPLAPGAERRCTIDYTLTQADVDAGTVTNTATATATDGFALINSNASSATVTLDREPGLSLVKSASPSAPAYYKAGQQVTYSFVVTNTGNVTVTDAGVVEGTFTGSGTLGAVTCPSATDLAPGAQLICTADYTLTQADIDAGSVSNTATATGTGPNGVTPPVSPASKVTIPEKADPALALVKTADVTKLSTVGQTVTYTFAVTNTGNTTDSQVRIHEGAFTGHGAKVEVNCVTATLLPGEKAMCIAGYTVVAADLDGKPLSNTATATSDTTTGATVTSDPSTARIVDVARVDPPADPSDPLATTGTTISWGAGILAVGLIATGAVLMFLRRRRRSE